MDKETELSLLRLRNDLINTAIEKSELQKLLIKFFPKGTNIVITKDYWKINEPKEKD